MSKKFSNGFYFRCVGCNDTLSDHYVHIGLCSICNRSARNAANPDYTEGDNLFVEIELWRNPMSGTGVTEDAEATYQGENPDNF